MNPTTTLIAQLAGPTLIAVGLGMLLNRSLYAKMYTAVATEVLAVFFMAIVMIIVGYLIVLNHNLWSTPTEIIVSLLGWGTLLKGIVLVVLPQWTANFTSKLPLYTLLPFAAIVTIVLGSYLVWAADFAS